MLQQFCCAEYFDTGLPAFFSEFAHRLTEDVPGTSVFLFGHADDERRPLVTRRKELRWFANDSKIKPDMGEFSPGRGIVGKS